MRRQGNKTGPTLPLGFGLLLARPGMFPPPIFLDFLSLHHIPLFLLRIMDTLRNESALSHTTDILGGTPFLDQFGAVFEGLAFFSGDGANLLGGVGFPDTDT